MEFELRHFDRAQQIVHVFLITNLILVPLKQGQHNFIKEDPFVLEKMVEKGTHVFTRYHGCKKPEDPLACVNVRS